MKDAPIYEMSEVINIIKLNACAKSPTVDSLYGLKLLVTNRRTRLDLPTPESPSSTT